MYGVHVQVAAQKRTSKEHFPNRQLEQKPSCEALHLFVQCSEHTGRVCPTIISSSCLECQNNLSSFLVGRTNGFFTQKNSRVTCLNYFFEERSRDGHVQVINHMFIRRRPPAVPNRLVRTNGYTTCCSNERFTCERPSEVSISKEINGAQTTSSLKERPCLISSLYYRVPRLTKSRLRYTNNSNNSD